MDEEHKQLARIQADHARRHLDDGWVALHNAVLETAGWARSDTSLALLRASNAVSDAHVAAGRARRLLDEIALGITDLEDGDGR